MCSRMARLSHLLAVADLDQNRGQTGGIEQLEVAAALPIAFLHLGKGQPLFAQRQPHLARGRVERKVVHGAFDGHGSVQLARAP